MVQAQENTLFNQNEQISHAISTALTFLLEVKNPEGWWEDFHSPTYGTSNQWITAYVAGILANVDEPQAFEAVKIAWELLKPYQRDTGGWSYNHPFLEDSDSTLWALKVAEAVDARDSEEAIKAISFLEGNKLPNSGIATYGNEEMFRKNYKMPPHIEIEGHCMMAHVCVNAAIAILPEFNLYLRDYLKTAQTSEGHWYAYWWRDHEFATALAAEALAACGQADDQSCIDRAIAWGLKRLSPQGFVKTSFNPDGSPFATAMCLRLLLLDTANPEVEAAIKAATRWLLEQQQKNGSWISSARLQVPYFNDKNPEQFNDWQYHRGAPGGITPDQNSTHTTATVLYSLHKVAERLEQ